MDDERPNCIIPEQHEALEKIEEERHHKVKAKINEVVAKGLVERLINLFLLPPTLHPSTHTLCRPRAPRNTTRSGRCVPDL